MFGVPDFENWINSTSGKELRANVQSQSEAYVRYMDFLMQAVNNFQWNPEDQQKVIPALMSNMDLNFLHNVVSFKLKEIKN